MDADTIIVLDVGSSCIKAGYAGEDSPRSVFPCVPGHPVVGAEKYRQPGPPRYQDAAEQAAIRRGGVANLNYDAGSVIEPTLHGHSIQYKDWERLEAVYEYAVGIGVDNDKPGTGGASVMLTEAPLADPQSREQCAQWFFETAGAPRLCAANSGVLSLLASGRTTGIVLECGGGVASAVPVFEGFALHHATLKIYLGGQDLTAALQLTLQTGGADYVSKSAPPADGPAAPLVGKKGGGWGKMNKLLNHRAVEADRFSNYAVCQQIKEHCCYLPLPSLSPGSTAAAGTSAAGPERGRIFELPDGAYIDLSRSRCNDAEAVFFPALARQRYALPSLGSGGGARAADPKEGLASLVARSLALCDAELQKELRGAVVCSGGSTLLPGFPARLEAELNALCPDLVGGPSHRPFSVVPDPIKPERGYNTQRGSAAWCGASLFASLDDTYGCVAVSKAEWDEWGPSIVHRKFF